MRIGKIVAVCVSQKSGVPKVPRKSVFVDEKGFVGDLHNGKKRQISIVAQEVLDILNKDLAKYDIYLKPGDFRENLTVSGLGDLSQIEKENILQIGDVYLKVIEQMEPCARLMARFKLKAPQIYGRRGVAAIVYSGVGKTIKLGDVIQII